MKVGTDEMALSVPSLAVDKLANFFLHPLVIKAFHNSMTVRAYYGASDSY